ncbi:MAG TPA: helix-turn-helix domain-containing protein [Flavobacteriaceae bacterium]|nr:helix-turn-helix domain-containing protein [Flavobacteriaceae bacterium]
MTYKNTHVFFLILCSLLSSKVHSQDSSKNFNDLRISILSEIAARDIDEALSYTDTLKELANTRRQEIQTTMTRAVLHNQQGDIDKALNIAMDAESAFVENKNHSDQIGAVGFIASNFRELGWKKEALFYLDRAGQSLDKLENKHLKGQYGALLNHEKIGLYDYEKQDKKVEKAIADAYKFVDLIEEGGRKSFFLATTIYLEATTKFENEDFQQAEKLFLRAKETLGTKNELLYGQIKLGLAQIYLERDNYPEAKNTLEQVETMVENSQYYQLKKEFLKLSSAYYYKKGNIEQYKKYNNLYAEEQQLTDDKSRQISAQSLAQLRLKVATKQKRIWYVSSIMGVLGLGLVVVIIVNYRRNKKNIRRFREIIGKLRKGQTIEASVSDNEQSNNQMPSVEQSMIGEAIAEDTEKRILEELTRLESIPEVYLQPNVSLSKIAATVDTNTKYLTLTIRKHHHKSFNAYVNDFRINYILNKLQKEPKYLAYKISYLAEKSGFSSHSKFSSEFKRVVGMPPSIFINQLKTA